MFMSVAIPLAFAFSLQDGDKVLFYGDSITEQRLYTTYAETLVRTRYPNLKVSFVTRGVGGDTAKGGWMGTIEQRVKRDVESQKPTRVTIMLGMNDAGYVPYTPEGDRAFKDSYQSMLDLMKIAVPKAKLTLIRTSPYDNFSTRAVEVPGYNDTLIKFGKHVLDFSKRGGHEYVDFNEPVAKVIRSANRSNALLAATIIPDAIHPAASGHILMAGALVKAWGMTPTVSSLWFDGLERKVIQSQRTKVAGLSAGSGSTSISWTQSDLSLPFPTDPSMVPTLIYSDFLEAVNLQLLRVTRLEPGEYRLTIDGEEVGSWKAAEFAQGVNLSTVETPMSKQAETVQNLIIKRNELDIAHWSRVNNPEAPVTPGEAEVKALSVAIEDLHAQSIKAAQPKARVFRLIKL